MAFFKCKMCGGTIEFEQGATVGVCDSCGTKQTLPRLDNDRRANLYDRANHFRRNNEFDKAASIYEQILTEDTADAEAYWSLVLCNYGIEYVEDPATRNRVPTVNRAQFTSVFDDDNYKSALKYADGAQRELYEKEARTINEIQKGILAISQKEEPFDVFICYKETDRGGRRTPDSVLANDLYHQLTQEGFKVFFSRITLEDKLGTAYEPYIFAALNTAKVMVVLGTKPEYFNAVWVKNEWSRYLALVKKSGGRKVLIPAYKDMDPYDLPDEFSHLQAQDMSKLGFMQDLIRGIKKIAQTAEAKVTVKETVVTAGNTNTGPLLERAFIFLEDGNWEEADSYCEKVLDLEPRNAQAYIGKLMAELHVRRREDLPNCEKSFDDSNNYQKAVRFGDEKTADELKDYIAQINDRNETLRLTGIYNSAVYAMNSASSEATYKAAAAKFKTISWFRDADALAEKCLEKAEACRKDAIYAFGKSKMSGNLVSSYKAAINVFLNIPGWRDSDELVSVCQRKIDEIKTKEESDRLELERREEAEALERKRREEEYRYLLERNKRNTKRFFAVAITVLVCIVALTLITVLLIIPAANLNKAISLMENGKYVEARTTLVELDGFGTSSNKIAVIDAIELIKNGDYDAGIKKALSVDEPISISYHLNGGESSNGDEFNYSASTDYPGLISPAKKGYSFVEWQLEKCTYSSKQTLSIVLEAVWSDGYQITYELDGGQADNPSEYHKDGESVTLTNPVKEGYTFVGWTGTDLNLPTVDVSIPRGSYGNKEYIAHWNPNEYTFTLNSNGGSVDVSSFSAKYDSAYSLPTPVREYYTFNGWYSGTTKYDDGFWGDACSVVLVANWTPISYSVTYNCLAEGTNSMDNPTEFTVESSIIELSAPNRIGYKFNGWYGDSSFTKRITSIPSGTHENIVLYANWEIINYKITYQLNGGTMVGTKITSFTVEDLPLRLPEATKDGLVFLNWGKDTFDGEVVETITSIGDVTLAASYLDPNLKLSLNKSGSYYVVKDYTGSANEVTIPAYYQGKPVSEIGLSAFSESNQSNVLVSITIPKTVSKIGEDAFIACKKLTNISIPDGIKTIEWGTFYNCESLTSIDIPDSVTSIADSAFSGCHKLVSISLPSKLTSIGKDAFAFCRNLKEIIVPDGITVLKEDTFYECEKLSSVVLPESLIEIEQCVFLDCESLHRIVIPASVTKMGHMIFYGCPNITIYCRAKSIPDGWSSGWNSVRTSYSLWEEYEEVHTVVWGYTGN